MVAILKKVKNIIPFSLRKYLLSIHQQYVFKRAVNELKLMIDRNVIDKKLLERLIYGWGNQGYSAQTDYLETCIEYAYKTNKAILECGTGLSTIVVGMIAQKKGVELFSFEHHKEWGTKVSKAIQKIGLKSVSININPLKDYGLYCWYDIHTANIPSDIGLVICDGPPAQTKGGRFGLVPQIDSLFVPGAVILMDDTARDAERIVMEKWKELKSFDIIQKGEHDLHSILILK